MLREMKRKWRRNAVASTVIMEVKLYVVAAVYDVKRLFFTSYYMVASTAFDFGFWVEMTLATLTHKVFFFQERKFYLLKKSNSA